MPPKGFSQFFDTNGGRQTATHHTIFRAAETAPVFLPSACDFLPPGFGQIDQKVVYLDYQKHQSKHLTIHPVQPTRIMKKNKKKDIGYQSLQAFKKARREEEIQAHGKSINYASVTKDKTKYTRKEKHKKRLNGDD